MPDKLRLTEIGLMEVKSFRGPYEDDLYYFIPSGNAGEFLIVYESAYEEYSIDKKTKAEIKKLYNIDL